MTTESHLSRDGVRSRSVKLDGLFLVDRRTARGLNQVEAAERMKIAVGTLSLAENGRPVLITTAATIAKFYDLKVGDARDGAVASGTGATAVAIHATRLGSSLTRPTSMWR